MTQEEMVSKHIQASGKMSGKKRHYRCLLPEAYICAQLRISLYFGDCRWRAIDSQFISLLSDMIMSTNVFYL